MDVLKLSYDDLPQKLKPCFLYFGIYPEDKKIPARELIQLWIAEGFIQPEESGVPNAPEPEDVGEEYLNELVDRSLVQVASRRSDDGVKNCQVHDLLRDLCISQSKTNEFLEVFTNSSFHTPSNPRRLSLLRNVQSYNSSIKYNQSCTRSLFFFDREDKGDILKNFQSISVLYVEHLLCSSSYLKRMPHLRFIKIVISYLSEIPECFWKLENLETLDIRSCNHTGRIPSKLWKLQRLRHLCARLHVRLPTEYKLIPKRKIMWNLQTLKFVLVDQQLGFLISEGVFPNLRNLGLEYDHYSRPEYLKDLHNLSHLRTLSIRNSQRFLLSLDEIVFPLNLTKITLSIVNHLDSKDMKVLGQITTLQILKIAGYNAYELQHAPLCCGGAGDFPQLLVFHMKEISTVSELILEEGAMPRLQCVVFHHCPHLKEVPERLVSLGNLQRVSGFYLDFDSNSCVHVKYWETA